jgi:hypothetical protein
MMVRLRTFTDRTEACIAQARLHKEGLHCLLRNETIHGILPVGALDVQLWVREEDVTAAAGLLEGPGNLSDPEEEDYREIGHREIGFLRRRQQWRRYRLFAWILIGLLIVLLILAGW